MQSCRRCNIIIRGSKYCCPLCGGELSGEADPGSAAYPVVHLKVKRLSIVRLAVFCFIAMEIAMIAVQYLAGRTMVWALFAMAMAAVGCLDLVIAFYYRHSALKMVTNHAYLGMVIAAVVDYLTGFRGWSFAWVIPCAFVGLAAATILIGIIQKMMPEDYIIYLFAAIGISFAQLIFIHMGLNQFRWPAVISMTILAILAVGALLFLFRAFKSAASRVFHV